MTIEHSTDIKTYCELSEHNGDEQDADSMDLLFCNHSEDEEETLEEFVSKNELTGRIVAQCLFDIRAMNGVVYYVDKEPGMTRYDVIVPAIPNVCMEESYPIELIAVDSEQQLLKRVWEDLDQSQRLITFNGRSFTVPFLNVRSAMWNIAPLNDYMGNRYDFNHHIDLQDIITGFGNRPKTDLRFTCRKMRIPLPENFGRKPSEINQLMLNGNVIEVARACASDGVATGLLWKSRIRDTIFRMIMNDRERKSRAKYERTRPSNGYAPTRRRNEY